MERKTEKDERLNISKYMAIDLGANRTATTFDCSRTITYSGKKIKSLVRLRNKMQGKTKRNIQGLKKHGRRYKKIRRAYRRVSKRIQDKIKDILHKCSRTIVNYCKKEKIGKIIFGDCSGIHNHTNLGDNNQLVQQNPEQVLRQYIEDKFEVIGGVCDSIPEYYTSKACPKCKKLNEPDRRKYRCKSCGFRYDRDGVGSVNIYCLYHAHVSFGEELNVVGLLTEPIGWKYSSSQDCLVIY